MVFVVSILLWMNLILNLFQTSKLMLPHLYQESIERFIVRITRFSRESRADSQDGLKMTFRELEKENVLVLMVVRI